MDRRRFLEGLFAAGAGLALAPRVPRAALAAPDDAARFARALAAEPWRIGWRGADRAAYAPVQASVEGRLPDGFAGTLYRDGPGWFERGGLRYRHWFDGDGLLRAWRFADGAVEHRARMIATAKFTREQAAGRFLLPAAGTTVPDAVPIRNNDDLGTANTAVIRHAGRLLALWEGGSAIAVEPGDLRAAGPVRWRDDLAAAPFSAHPLADRDGSLWNFGSLDLVGGSGLLVWRIGADGRLASATVLPTPARGYLHSFAMTARHLVFVLTPYRLDSSAGAFFERLRFLPGEASRVAVVPKDAPAAARWFEADFGAVYHYADAYERGGELLVRAVRHRDVEAMRAPMAATMRGGDGDPPPAGELATLRVDLAGGRARWEASGVHALEFPQFDPAAAGAPAGAPVYAPVRRGIANAPYFNAVAAIDLARGREAVHRYGADVLAEEHVFVPKPGRRRAGEGWLVGALLDAARGRSGVAVLDAERVADGPLAQAWLPHALPLGFHGCFAA